MSKKTLEEIIAAVPADALRRALEQKRAECEAEKALSVVEYGIEKVNPHLRGAAKKRALARIEDTIRKWVWAIDNIDERLDGADDALRGQPNRGARRRQEREA